MMTGRTWMAVTGMIALTAAGADGARAQDAPPPAPPLVTELASCRAITADPDRLACFDRAAGRLATAIERREVVVLDQAEVKRTRRSLFGFSIPRIGFLRGDGRDGDEEPEFRELTSTIKSARGIGYGKWRLGVDEATWQTTEPLRSTPRAGEKVHIKRGLMGSFFLAVDGGRAVKAIRVE